jgi:hypothetical protein
MNANRMKAMLKYLPCRAGGIPLNLRQLGAAEQEGLARDALRQAGYTIVYQRGTVFERVE